MVHSTFAQINAEIVAIEKLLTWISVRLLFDEKCQLLISAVLHVVIVDHESGEIIILIKMVTSFKQT